MKKTMIDLCIFLSFCIIVQNSFDKGWPDALRCGDGSSPGAIYIVHAAIPSGAVYHQVYSGEMRFVIFNGDGTFNRGGGHYDSFSGCNKKSISQLRAQGRAFQMTDQRKVLQKFAQIEKLMTQKFNSYEAKLLMMQAGYEAKIKALDEKLQKLVKENVQLKTNEVQMLKDSLKECRQQKDKKILQVQKIQRLERKVDENKKEVDQKIANKVEKINSKQKDVLERINVLEQTSKRLRLEEYRQKIEKIISFMNRNDNQNLKVQLSKLQKRFKTAVTDLLKKYTNLQAQISQCCSNDEAQSQRLGKEVQDKTNNLKSEIQITDAQEPKSKPKQ